MELLLTQKQLKHELRTIISSPISRRDPRTDLSFSIEQGKISADISPEIQSIVEDLSVNEPLDAHKTLKDFCIAFNFNFSLIEVLKLDDKQRQDLFLDLVKEYCFSNSRRGREYLRDNKVKTKYIKPFEQVLHVIPRFLKNNEGIILFVRSKTASKKYFLGERDFLISRTINAVIDALTNKGFLCANTNLAGEVRIIPVLVKTKTQVQDVLDVFKWNDYITIG